MENVLELKEKVADIEKRIIFLYKMLEKQSKINQKIIDNQKQCQDALTKYTSATNNNTFALNVLADRFFKEEED